MRGQRGNRAYQFHPGGQYPTSVRAAEVWREVITKERSSLYASPARCEEIERMQPESDACGLALFYRPGTVTGTVKERSGKSHPIEEEPETVVPVWRKTFSFP